MVKSVTFGNSTSNDRPSSPAGSITYETSRYTVFKVDEGCIKLASRSRKILFWPRPHSVEMYLKAVAVSNFIKSDVAGISSISSIYIAL